MIKLNKEGALKDVDIKVTDPVSLGTLIIAGMALGWQIYRDMKRDRDEKKRNEN
jgi:hypothetical protein